MHAPSRRPPSTLIYAITVTGVTVNTLVSPGIPNILDALGAPASAAGLVIASATFPGIFLAPATGFLADRYGRREVLVPCLVLFGAAGLAAAFATSLWTFVAFRLLQGAGSAGLINLAVVLIGDHWDGTERVTRIGRNSAVLTVAVAAMPTLGGGLTDLFGWRGPFYLVPVAMLTALGVLRTLPRTTRSTRTLRAQVRDAVPYLRTPVMIGTLVAGVIVFVLVFGLLLTVMPVYLEQRFGLSAGLRGLVMGLPALTASVFSLNMGRLTARFGRRRLLVFAPMAWSLAIAVLATAPSVGVIVTGALLFGVGDGIMIPALQDIAASIAPDSSRGTVVAAWVGAARGGQTIGPLGASSAMGAYGPRATFWGGAVLAAGMVVLAGAGVRYTGRAAERGEA